MHVITFAAFSFFATVSTAHAQDMGQTDDDCPAQCWTLSMEELDLQGIDCSECDTGSEDDQGDTGTCTVNCDDWGEPETGDTGWSEDDDTGWSEDGDIGTPEPKSQYQECLDTDDLKECYACCISTSDATRCQDACDKIVDGFDAKPFGPPTSLGDIIGDYIEGILDWFIGA